MCNRPGGPSFRRETPGYPSMTDQELRELFKELAESREAALDAQTKALEKLFDEKIKVVRLAVLQEVATMLLPLQTALAINKVKIAGLLAGCTLIASGISAWLVKTLISVVVVK